MRQLKVEEADRLFSGSEKDIEKLVEDYRQTLLVGKVDQYYVDQQMGGDFTDEDIAEYYWKTSYIFQRNTWQGIFHVISLHYLTRTLPEPPLCQFPSLFPDLSVTFSAKARFL